MQQPQSFRRAMLPTYQISTFFITMLFISGGVLEKQLTSISEHKADQRLQTVGENLCSNHSNTLCPGKSEKRSPRTKSRGPIMVKLLEASGLVTTTCALTWQSE
jgi:hypothetical protein